MTFRLKLTHFHTSVHVVVPDLIASTIIERCKTEFPELQGASQTLRWLDADGDWIEIRPDDKDLESILKEMIALKGIVHIQTGDYGGVYEPIPLGSLMSRYECVMDSFDHLSRNAVKLPPISSILIVTKPDPKLYKLTKELSVYLLETFPGVTIHVDKKLLDRSSFRYEEMLAKHPSWADRLRFWTTLECDKYAQDIHLVVTLGGDGTVLYTASMFQHRVPPIVAFHLGSLGFLTNFSFDNYKPTMTNILKGEGMNINIRMRLQCTVYKYKEPPSADSALTTVTYNNASDSEDDEALEALQEQKESERRAAINQKVKEMDSKKGSEVADMGLCLDHGQTLITRTPKPQRLQEFFSKTDSWQVLNEVTVDRGSNAGMLQLELFVDGNHVTTILADGLVIATATGSTAYSLSIGGSLIHPDKNSIIISPIAPHSLTARPMIIPGTKHLRICVPSASRTTAWASFDGRYRQELGRGDSVMITASKYPAVTICRRDQSMDWFTGLTQVLNWNSRVLQKPLGSHL